MMKTLPLTLPLCTLLVSVSMITTAAEKVTEDLLGRWVKIEKYAPEPEEVEIQQEYFFSDDPPQLGTDGETEGEEGERIKPITSGFDCYEHTNDFDRDVCLDPEIGVLMEQLKRQYSLRIAIEPLSQHSIIERRQKKWDEVTRFRCLNDMLCIRDAIHERMLEVIAAPPIYRQDLRLNPAASPVTIVITGRKANKGFLLDSLLHVEPHPETGRDRLIKKFDFYRFMRSRYFELPHPTPSPYLIDANFDGWKDLVFIARNYAEGLERIYLLYDPEKGTFTTNALLNAIQQPVFIDKYQIIETAWIKDANYGIDYYRYKNNKLVRDIRVIYSQSVNEQDKVVITMSTYSNRTGRMTKIRTDPVTIEQVGDLPDIYTNPRRTAAGNQAQVVPLQQ